MKTGKCKICGEIAIDKRGRERTYCSRRCWKEGRKIDHGTAICEECGQEFVIKEPCNPNRVCSNACKYRKISRLQRALFLKNNPMKRKEVVQNWRKVAIKALKRGTNHPQWNGGMEYTRDGYRLIYKPDHPNAHKGKIREHRLVMENYFGKYLKSSELVHHINGNKKDNRIENLQLLTRSDHTRLHRKGQQQEI